VRVAQPFGQQLQIGALGYFGKDRDDGVITQEYKNPGARVLS